MKTNNVSKISVLASALALQARALSAYKIMSCEIENHEWYKSEVRDYEQKCIQLIQLMHDDLSDK